MIRQIKIQIQKLNHKLYQLKDKATVSYSITLPLILSKLNIQIDDSDSFLTHYTYGMFLISLVGLLCFINIIGYMIVFIVIQKSELEEKIKDKYPRLSKYITYYKNSNIIFASLDALTCLVCLVLLLSFSLLIIYSKFNV